MLKTGSGTLSLGGSNSYTGGLTVNGGVLALTAAQSYGARLRSLPELSR